MFCFYLRKGNPTNNPMDLLWSPQACDMSWCAWRVSRRTRSSATRDIRSDLTPYLPDRFLKGPYKRGLFPGGFPKGDGEKHQRETCESNWDIRTPFWAKRKSSRHSRGPMEDSIHPQKHKNTMVWLNETPKKFMCNLEGEPSFPVRFGDVAPGSALGLSRSCQAVFGTRCCG